jgi:hypothetical protein
MNFKILNSVENVGIRIEISDEDKTFATALFMNLFSAKAGEAVYRELDVDVKMVMNGDYHTIYTVFTTDPFGNTVDLDCITGLDIRLKDVSREKALIWHNEQWGNICL